MGVGLFLVVYGWQNFLTGFGSFRMPSMLAIAYLYAPIPLCGALVALFSLEQSSMACAWLRAPAVRAAA